MNSWHRVCEVAGVFPYLLERGLKPGKVLTRVGIPTHAILDPDAWIPRDLFLALINSSTAGDPHGGIHIGEIESFEQFGALGKAILAAPTLRAAIGVVCRHTGLIQTDTKVRLCENRQTACLSYSYLGRARENPDQYVEGALVFFYKLLGLTGQRAIVDVSFGHVPSQKSQELERVFGPRLTLDAAEDALVFDRALLDLPLQSSTAASPQVLCDRSCEEEVVRAVLINMSDRLAYETPTLEKTAAVLGLHARTLERRLSRWGTPFEALLDEFRRSRSLQLIQQGTHTLTEIAFLIGYSDAAHFTRAFRRWTGSPPRDYVRGHRLSHEFDTAKPQEDILSEFPFPLRAVLAK
jgi:AraC-like DNA-binding protein